MARALKRFALACVLYGAAALGGIAETPPPPGKGGAVSAPSTAPALKPPGGGTFTAPSGKNAPGTPGGKTAFPRGASPAPPQKGSEYDLIARGGEIPFATSRPVRFLGLQLPFFGGQKAAQATQTAARPATGGTVQTAAGGTAARPAISTVPTLDGASDGASDGAAAGTGDAQNGVSPAGKSIFLGALAGMQTPSYDSAITDMGGDITGNAGFNGGLYLGYAFGKMSVEAEALLSTDQAENSALTFSAMSLLVPFIVKWNLNVGPLVLQPLAGVYLNFNLGNLRVESSTASGEDRLVNPPLGIMAGAAAGIKLFNGFLFVDGRLSSDLGKTIAGDDVEIWQKTAFILSAGYQISLWSK